MIVNGWIHTLNGAEIPETCVAGRSTYDYSVNMTYEAGDVGEECSELPGQVEVKIMFPEGGDILHQAQYNGDVDGPVTGSASVAFENPGTYAVQVTYTLCGNEPVQYFYYITICSNVKVAEGDCGEFTITNNEVDPIDIVVTDGNESVVVATTLGVGESYELTISQDGAYSLKYTTTGENPVEYLYPIVSVCKVSNCVKGLITKILCADETDPCCKSCDEEASKKARMYRDELNKIIALWGMFLISSTDLIVTMKENGIFIFTEEKLRAIKDMDNLIVKLRALTVKCGEVDCDDTEVTTGGCSSC